MQEPVPVVERNTRKRRVFGYVTRAYRDLVSGGDAGYTAVKGVAILSIAGLVVSGLAIPIIVGGVVVGLIYVASGIVEERERNRIEDEKLIELNDLELEMRTIQGAIQQREADIQQLNNGQLLKLILHTYLTNLGLANATWADFDTKANKKRKANGKLPGQAGMIRLLESVTGFDRKSADFATQVKLFLNEQNVAGPAMPNDLGERVTTALNLGNDNAPNVNIHLQEKPKSKILKFIKNGFIAIAKSNTAAAFVIGSAILLGAVIVGTPIGWPILVTAAVLGVASGVANMVYNKYADNGYRKNIQNLDKNLQYQKTKYALLHKLDRQKLKNYQDLNQQLVNNQLAMRQFGERYALLREEEEAERSKSHVSFTTKARIVADTITQGFYGLSTGVTVGLTISTLTMVILAITLPPIGISILGVGVLLTIAGAVGGGIFGLRFSHLFAKAAWKSGNDEKATIEQVGGLKEKVQDQFSQQVVERELKKTKITLVAELIDSYINLAKIPANPAANNALDRKEVILRKLEEMTGIKRPRDAATGKPNNDHDDFYNKLSLYLQKHQPNSVPGIFNGIAIFFKGDLAKETAVNTKMSEFKSAVLTRRGAIVNQKKPDFLPTGAGIKEGLKSFNQKVQKYIFPFLGTVSVVFPLMFLLFGPTALIPVTGAVTALMIVGGVYLASFAVHKFLEYRAAKNLARVAETKDKIELVDMVQRTKAHIQKVNPGQAAVPVAKAAETADWEAQKQKPAPRLSLRDTRSDDERDSKSPRAKSLFASKNYHKPPADGARGALLPSFEDFLKKNRVEHHKSVVLETGGDQNNPHSNPVATS